MSQVNVNPGGGYRDDSAAAWSAATIAMIVGFILLLAVLVHFLATQAALARRPARATSSRVRRQEPPNASS